MANSTFDPDRIINMPIDQVVVKDRIREDFGDIATLADSMERLGQLQPIVVHRKDGQLLIGGRRLAAAKKLKWPTIRAVVTEDYDDALKAYQAEIEENEGTRKDFTKLEKAKFSRMLRQLEELKAKERMESGKKAEGEKGSVRDRIAERLGLSGPTLDKASDILDAAERDPQTFGDLAKELDKDKASVSALWNELKKRGGAKVGSKSKKKAAKKARKKVYLDAVGQEIPEKLHDKLSDSTIMSMVAQLREMVRLLKTSVKWNKHLQPHITKLVDGLTAEVELLVATIPYAVCTGCKGHGCAHCLQSGWLPEHLHKDLVKRDVIPKPVKYDPKAAAAANGKVHGVPPKKKKKKAKAEEKAEPVEA